MNRILSILFFFCTVLFSLKTQAKESNPKEKVKLLLLETLLRFKTENVKQKNLFLNPNTRKNQFKKTRFAYKRGEYFLGIGNAYEFRLINGPNLDYDAYSGGASQLWKAAGLQKMEAMLFAEESDSTAYFREVEKLDDLLGKIIDRGQQIDRIPEASFHQIIWEALKMEIFRIQALGITGYDSPESEWGIEESVPALEGVRDVAAAYKGTTYLSAHLGKSLQKQLQAAIIYLRKNKDFENFDRIFFIKTHLHPISRSIYAIQTANNWIYAARKSGLNPQASYLWERKIFDADYFKHEASESIVKAGEKLFFDKKLNPFQKISCGDCHQPKHAYADNVVFSRGAGNIPLSRNTPSLWNSAFQTKFFLDGRRLKLHDQIFDVIHDPKEMASNMAHIIAYTKSDPQYMALFKAAFGRDPDEYTILMALEFYVRHLVSFDSEFDAYMRDEKKEIAPEVIRGFNLFTGKAKCATCHFMPLFNGLLPPFYDESEFEVLGTPFILDGKMVEDADLGRYLYTQNELHKRAFKTTGVRNIQFQAPYMHNGVFATLEEVMAFYNNGGGIGHGIHTPNQTLPGDSLRLTEKEISDIIAFMKSLEDTVVKRF